MITGDRTVQLYELEEKVDTNRRLQLFVTIQAQCLPRQVPYRIVVCRLSGPE